MRTNTLIALTRCVIALALPLCIGPALQAAGEPGLGLPKLMLQLGHSGDVNAVAISRDQSIVVTGGDDETVRLWDAKSGRELARLDAGGSVNAVDISIDGSVMLAGVSAAGSKGHVHVWRIKTLERIARMNDVGSIAAAVFSPDRVGTQVLVGSQGAAFLWDRASVSPPRRLDHKGGGDVKAVAFSPDGQTVVTADAKRFIRLWNSRSGLPLRTVKHPLSPPLSVKLTAHGQLLVGGDYGGVVAWDFGGGADDPVELMPGLIDTRGVIGFSSDGRYAIYAGSGGQDLAGRSVYLVDLQGRFAAKWRGMDVASLKEEGPRLVLNPANVQARELKGHGNYVVAGTFCCGDSRLITASGDRTARLWDVTSGASVMSYEGLVNPIQALATSRDGQFLLIGSGSLYGQRDGVAYLWDLNQGREVRRLTGHSDIVTAAAFSEDSTKAATGSGGQDASARIWTVADGQPLHQLDNRGAVASVGFSADGRRVLTTVYDNTARLWDVVTGEEQFVFGGVEVGEANGRKVYSGSPIEAPFIGPPVTSFLPNGAIAIAVEYKRGSDNNVFIADTAGQGRLLATDRSPVVFMGHSEDGRRIITGHGDKQIRVWQVGSGKLLQTLSVAELPYWLDRGAVSPDGKRVIVGSSAGNEALIIDIPQAAVTARLQLASGNVSAFAFDALGRFVVVGTTGGVVHLWNGTGSREMARLISLPRGGWVVAAPDGRFDTANLDQVVGMHWTMDEEPTRPFPLEVFMRDYYEPRLLPRIMAGELFTSIPSLASLNRAQPGVRIRDVRFDDPQAGLASILVEVEDRALETQLRGRAVTAHSGVFDLRLFRNGQLVARMPESADALANAGRSREQELAAWRRRSGIAVDPGTGRRTITFRGIQVARGQAKSAVEFSAYAFNVDRVKSDTARQTIEIPKTVVRRQGRAYIVAIGVNEFERSDLSRLKFAANDARQFTQELGSALARLRDPATSALLYGKENVVVIPLLSETATTAPPGRSAVDFATKYRIKAVIEVLAGRSVDTARLEGITDAARLRPAGPEDLVILAFSTHGDTDAQGQFYVMPSDVGPSRRADEGRERAISSEELAQWLGPVDAGEMVMIIDACHSAASVQAGEFKPGPMGSRGLGQLAFDKGMRILAASQRDQVALETENTQQGLLSYALVREGLRQGRADFKPVDGRILMSEWLAFAAARVPGLYVDFREGRLKVRTAVPLDEPEARERVSIQQPALFDFGRGTDSVLTTVLSR